MTVLIAITFGPAHDELYQNVAPNVSLGYVVVEAPTATQATVLAFGLTNGRHAFTYEVTPEWLARNQEKGWHPEGELLRVAWIQGADLDNYRAQIDYTFELADGDSNDEEIEGLQRARDMLAEIVGYTSKED